MKRFYISDGILYNLDAASVQDHEERLGREFYIVNEDRIREGKVQGYTGYREYESKKFVLGRYFTEEQYFVITTRFFKQITVMGETATFSSDMSLEYSSPYDNFCPAITTKFGIHVEDSELYFLFENSEDLLEFNLRK